MTSTHLPAPPEPIRFSRRQAAADASTAAWLREEFGQWLRRSTDLAETSLCDVVLAVNEALANAAEFAYLQDRGAGTVDVEGVLDGASLVVTVCDRGQWRASAPEHRQRCRGRGIPLMRTLADEVVITTSPAGTRVSLRFEDVGLPRGADAMV